MLTKRESSGVYLRIVDGSIVKTSNVEQPGYELFTTRNPQTGQDVKYWIDRLDLKGHLTGFARVDKPDKHIHGWQLTIDGNEHLSLNDKRYTTTRVLKMLRNVNLDKELEIRVWKDGEGKTAIAFKQDGENVPQKWDKSNLPEPEQRANGQLDRSKSEDILYQDALEFSKELERRVTTKDEVTSPEFTGSVEMPNTEIKDDDIPW